MSTNTYDYQITMQASLLGWYEMDHNYGDIIWVFYKRIQEWLDENNVVFEYEVLDQYHDKIIIEFERLGQAAIFLVLFNI